MKNILFALVLFSCGFLSAQQPVEGITTMGTDTIETMPIVKGDTVEAVFYFANTGTLAFPIWQVHPGCQCTAPQYPHDSIRPGQTDSLIMMFHSKNTDELQFEKYVIVLTPLGEKTYIIRGNMRIASPSEMYKPKKYRITNLPKKP